MDNYNLRMDEFNRRLFAPRPDDVMDPTGSVYPSLRTNTNNGSSFSCQVTSSADARSSSRNGIGIFYLFVVGMILYILISPVHALLLRLGVAVFCEGPLNFFYDLIWDLGRPLLVISVYFALFLWSFLIPLIEKCYWRIFLRLNILLILCYVVDPQLAEFRGYVLINFLC